MTTDQGSDILGAGEVAAAFGVTTKSVGRWADEGLIPSFRTPGGTRRFRRGEVERALRELSNTPRTAEQPSDAEAVGA